MEPRRRRAARILDAYEVHRVLAAQDRGEDWVVPRAPASVLVLHESEGRCTVSLFDGGGRLHGEVSGPPGVLSERLLCLVASGALSQLLDVLEGESAIEAVMRPR